MRLPALAALLALTNCVPAHTQTAAPRVPFDAFEVATIRPADPLDLRAGRYMRMQSAQRFQVENYTVKDLIAAAYNLNPRAVSGGPGWVDSDRYEIIAKTRGELRPTFEDQMAMLRKLLADRFGLAFHRETKTLSIYQLTVLPGGAKIKATTAQPDDPSNVTSTVYPGAGGLIDHLLMPARNVTMAQFAAVLQRAIFDKPVVDTTGLTGRYDFDLEWLPDETQFGGELTGAQDSAHPGIYAAFREQLGLKIVATRGPVETLVIDRVDRPTES